MTSRPGLGIQESLHSRSSSGAHSRRRPSKPVNALPTADLIDPALEDDRPSAHHGANDAARPPPRGRPQLFYTTVASNGIELPIHSFPYQPTANLPVPPRPGTVHLSSASQQQRILPGGTGVKDPPKLTAPEIVAAPVQFPGGKGADVFPWTGNNAEDTLSEALVKVGINNKPQIMNETNTARPSLWSNLKNKSGINTLTTLFVAVLEKRQQSGRLQAPNTFKPPPRLTLRDSTREGWLHDLANPTASIRRLSRTIPHGLTGKVLLEQCLNKNIPLPRAIWLAKCVGINELRAHKRKGQAGTVTWGRGWTSSVEQFLDGVMSTIGQGDWKHRMTYALQLATHLYKEHLLDDDHFLDWILHGLETCPSERLFIWILVVSVSHYWTDITCCRRRGRRLAESLLRQLGKLYQQEDQLAFAALLQHLENVLLKLLATRPACLLLPSTWSKQNPVLQRLATKRQHTQITAAVKRIGARNFRLAQSFTASTAASQTAAARVLRKLDSVDYRNSIRIDDLSGECMEILPDAMNLVSVLLQWACSYYRDGTHRTYLAIRLLRRWSHHGIDIYEGIISHLQETNWAESGEPRILFRIVAELVRSKHFSAGRYLQWLIATGSLGHGLDISCPSSWPVRLITEIPISGLPDQVRNLRCTLLRGTTFSTEMESKALDYAKRSIAQALPALFGHDQLGNDLSSVNVDNLSPTVKFELGIWLRQQVAQHATVNDHVPTKDPSIEETAAISLITTRDFHLVRYWLEQFGDLAILADVIGIATSSLDSAVLATAADTLNYHFKAFRTIGALDPLFGRLAMRYAAIRTVRYPERELLLSLQNLARVVRPDGQMSQLIFYDLSRLDQKNSIAACSPASDSMGDVMQHKGTFSDDEIERILSSGTSMDQQMMARVFRKIVSNLHDHVAKDYSSFENYSAWFWRLRNFDEAAFDLVLHEWSISCLTAGHSEAIELAIPSLVSAGCMTLASFLDDMRTCVNRPQDHQFLGIFSTAIAGLRMLLHSGRLVETCSPQDAYRFRMEQDKLCRNSDDRILLAMAEVVALVTLDSSAARQAELASLLSTTPTLGIVKHHIINNPRCLAAMKVKNSNQMAVDALMMPLLDTLLDCHGNLHLAGNSIEERIFAVFKIANDLSLPICQAVLAYIFSVDSTSAVEVAETQSVALLEAVKTAVENDRPAGLELLASLDASLTNKIRQHAENEILEVSTFLTHATINKEEHFNQRTTALIKKYLKVMSLTTATSIECADLPAILLAVVDRLKGISQALSSYDVESASSQCNSPVVTDLYPWLNALLRIIVGHGSTISNNTTHAQQTAIMTVLRSLYTHPTLGLYPSITEHVFDTAVYISDFVLDDVRISIARSDSIKPMDDARCQFILGVAAPVDGWLVLTKPVHTSQAQGPSQPPTPIASQTPVSQPQNGQLSNPGPATTQQRYVGQPQQQRQQMQQAHQSQQLRQYSQFAQQSIPPNRNLPAQLQRTPSGQVSALQQMHLMQQAQGLAQQRATQPSPVHSQRPNPAANQGTVGGPVGGAGIGKLQTVLANQQREFRQYPFAQPRWELLADTSVNSNLNETSISLNLFGARKV